MTDIAFGLAYVVLLLAGIGMSVRFMVLWFRITRRPSGPRPLRIYQRMADGRLMSTNLEGQDWQEVPTSEREGIHR